MRDSVRGRLALLVVAITAPAVLLVAILTLQAYRNERNAVSQHLMVTARSLAAIVDHQIAQSEALLQGLAASRDLDNADFKSFDGWARAAVDNTDRWIVLGDTSGQQLVNTRVERGGALPHHEFEGEFGAAMRAGKTYCSNLVTGPITGQPALYVAVPVMRRGELRYTLGLAMRPSVFADIVDPAKVGPAIVVTVVDRLGTIAARYPNGDRYTGAKAARDVVNAAVAKAEGARPSVTLEGDQVLAAQAIAPESGWSVVLGAPNAALYASARRMLWSGFAVSGLLISLAILVAAWIGRALVRSVDSLVADTEMIGRGAVPAERSSGLIETDFVSDAMVRTARRLSDRERDNAALNAALQKELEKQRRADETARRLAALVESSEDAILGMDLAGVVTSWNQGAERIYGYAAQEIIGRGVSVLLPAGRDHEERQILEHIRRGERMDHFETVRRRKDGTLVFVSLSVSPIRDHTGDVIGASKIARDVTQRVRADRQQHALYELVARINRAEALTEVYESALTAVCQTQGVERAAILLPDAEGVLRFQAARGLSETYQRAVEGHSPWSPLQSNPQPVTIPNVIESTLAPAVRDAVLREGIRALAFLPLTCDQRLLGKFMIYFNAPHGFEAGTLRPIETIASQVAFAIERRKSAEALEALVDERTASLRQVVSQMEEFSYTVSHDLRAPVRAMRGYANVILEDHAGHLSAEGRELLGRIRRNSERMDRLIQDLLLYSRISRREIQLEPVSLDKLIREVLEEYPDMRPDRADIEVADNLPEVLAHEPSLVQVVSNLLSNAVKFVPPRARPHVRVGAECHERHARLWFEDNGIGIKPELQPKLFGMFERVHPDRPYEGTGIGLAIVRKAVERMNGAVGVESDGVSGSRFWFELPIAERPDRAA